MNTGTMASGIGHAAVILWVLVGGIFSRPPDAPAMAVTEVSLVSSAQFDAMLAAAPARPQTEAPAPVTPAPDAEVQAPPGAAPVVRSVVPPRRPESLDVAEAPPEVPDAPEPAAEPAPAPDPLPVTPRVEEQPVVLPQPVEVARPNPAPRVAPTPAETPEPDAEVAEVATPEVTPDAAAPEVVKEETRRAAPEAASTEIVTEETQTSDTLALAPASSPRPRTRPEAPAPVRTTSAQSTPDPAPDQVESADDAMAEAIAGAVSAAVASSSRAETPPAPAGPPLTAGEKDALRVAVQRCWNVGALSSDALLVTVTVSVGVAQTGIPDAGSIRMLGYEGGSEAGARQAYEAARRAIIRCGATGFDLPPEKYDQWRTIEMVFNPERMRIR